MEAVLFSYWRSSASWRVRIVLGLKGIAYRYEAVNLLESKQAQPEYTHLNPMKQVPTLEIDGKKLTQSLAIIQYLELTRTEVPIIPKDPYLATKMWEIAEIVNSGIQPLQNLTVLAKITELGGDRIAWATEAITKGLTAVEAVLSETAGTYAIGDSPSVADACIIPQLYSARRFNVPLDNFPILLRVEAACQSLSAFQAADAAQQPDSVS
mmetsp:Transcript_11737/g.22733  ORF Transcript_11737/g.22733 Transcript_11737/m.22733 type:complete len:210 (-) Transcript_11737:37-666(-)|eukprot:CAMPEP_0204897010 /NCGR_PEP_ID=MMETSP1397-20131031/495_1 /ASSEMBLY_ACC=CAM_ASM_000891 /TAXON_ID=49980 /ORGANISM="Climacostomum Climacostomum virens, Strain Stock W-24" /LENGTH=209 /DNA_ID=CAMNT_0052064707 /DNA_START=370 /DNA_END=999 /DNA_ORIENTATION=+